MEIEAVKQNDLIKQQWYKVLTEAQKLELEMIEEIGKTDNEKLMNMFLKWQNKRSVVNEMYLNHLENILKPK